jgi:phosphoglycolate phosphatase
VTEIPEITLACFGLIGTLVNDDGALELAFAEAIATQGVVSGTSAYARAMAQIHRARGQAPADILRDLFPENLARAQAAHLAFDRSLAAAVERRSLTPIPGAVKVLTDLAEAGCRICLVTSLPRRELTGMLRTMRWRELLTAALSAEDVPRGCPFPDLELAAMLRAGVGDVRETAAIHATAAGIECGRRAGAGVVVGVESGPHPPSRLRAAGATHVIDSVADLPAVLGGILRPATVPPQVPPSSVLAAGTTPRAPRASP